MPWELQTFVCTVCSAETVLDRGDDTKMLSSSDSNAARPSVAWADQYGDQTAVMSGETYRIVAYPSASPLAGKYGCYCDGRYLGLRANLAAAKAWCCGLSAASESTSILPA
ncbi:hypothetical protein FHP25_35145 [Vineibacter terrae]|uniref:Uncharacterized protein n=1 Tax=Vineibacter terrae TaxID=2586908 RepID=A0A5C8P9Q3_9HYPH|nr:hypothetical protein [Vineibacter terrae]TXL70266.1 hypothetical protein FHP25_35145 [Vineibacter terrae]